MANTLEYNIGFYVGRFQPFTKAHESLIRESIEKNNLDKLIIFFGSVNPPSNFLNETAFLNKNPYNMKKRKKFLKGSLTDLQYKLIYDGMLDYGSPKEEITDGYLEALQKRYKTNSKKNILINNGNNIGGISSNGKNRTHERIILKSTMWYYILAEKIFKNIMTLKLLPSNKKININLYFINSPKNGPTADYVRKINGITGRFLSKIINDEGLAKYLTVTFINAEIATIKNSNNKSLNAATIRKSMKELKKLKAYNNKAFTNLLNIIIKMNINEMNIAKYFKNIYDNYYLIKKSVPKYVFGELLKELL